MEIHVPLLIADIVASVIIIGIHLQEMNNRRKDNSKERK